MIPTAAPWLLWPAPSPLVPAARTAARADAPDPTTNPTRSNG